MAVDPRRKALLAELAYGDDPSVSAETRLRASEALAALPDETGDGLSERLIREMAALSEKELDSRLDPELADVVVALCGPVAGHPEDADPVPLAHVESHFPQTAEAVRYHIVERRAREIAAAKETDPEDESASVEAAPTPEESGASEAVAVEPVDDSAGVPSAPLLASEVRREGKEPYHGWTDDG